MTALRHRALLLSLTAGIVLGSAGSTAPAAASFKDSASVGTLSIATGTVAPPTNVVGKLNCTSPDSVMSATWTPSTSTRVTGYLLEVTFGDGYVQPVQLAANATSWSSPITKYDVIRYQGVKYSVSTQTAYGWTAKSPATGWFTC